MAKRQFCGSIRCLPARAVKELLQLALTLLFLFAIGCTRLAPGHLTDIAPPRSVNVCLIRGYLDWYSIGMDALASQLQSQGIHAEAFREEQWGNLADAVVQHPNHPVILIGFSYGADDVIEISRRLQKHDLPVDLLITIDPVTPAAVPGNVKHCVNFYAPSGFWDIFPWLRGVPLSGEPGVVLENINVHLRPDLEEPDTNHGTIAGNENVHRAIEALVFDAR
jgi:hypothetical protein